MPVTVTHQSSIWKQVLSVLESKLTNDRHTYESFFSESRLLKIEENRMTVLTNSPLCKVYFSTPNPHLSLLTETVKKIMGKEYSFSFVTDGELSANSKNAPSFEDVYSSEHTFFSNCKLNPKYTFDNFVVGDCNRDAVRAAIMVSNNPAAFFNPLFIYSKSGLGKTHLLHAIGNFYKDKHPDARVLYITTDAFIDEFVNYVRGSQENQSLRDFFKTVDLLLVDDIQFLSDKTKTAEMFFYIFNSLVNNGKQVVLTSDRQPKDLRGLEDRLVSRFNMGLSVNIQTPDTATLLEILKRKISSQGLNPKNYDEEGLVYMAETFSKNVRELEGALNRLIFCTVTVKDDERISLSTIQDAVKNMLPNSEKKKTFTEEDIIEAVANYYGLSSEQIYSKVRTAQIALARRIAMYLCRSLLGTPFVRIGEIFKRDHSTVMTGVDKVAREMKTDAQLSAAVHDIRKSLKK